MKITIMDYQGSKKEVEIGELKDISMIEMSVISGDEVLKVFYKNDDWEVFDSSIDRRMNYFDFDYLVYTSNGTNLLEKEEWLNRESSYDF